MPRRIIDVRGERWEVAVNGARTQSTKDEFGLRFVRIAGGSAQQAALVAELRRHATTGGGSAVLMSAPTDLIEQLGAWGPTGDAVFVQQRTDVMRMNAFKHKA